MSKPISIVVVVFVIVVVVVVVHPRNLTLKFGWNRTSNRWDIADIEFVWVVGGGGGVKSFSCHIQLLSWVEVELGLWQFKLLYSQKPYIEAACVPEMKIYDRHEKAISGHMITIITMLIFSHFVLCYFNTRKLYEILIFHCTEIHFKGNVKPIKIKSLTKACFIIFKVVQLIVTKLLET